jgi:nucleotide-binding universal stress UspA family protein
MPEFKRILFPTDFSANADYALHHALQLIDLHDCEVVVQHVVSSYFEKHPHWATLFDVHEIERHMDAYVSREMERAVPRGLDRNLVFRTMISEGRAAEEIVEAAEREQVDLVLMGPAKGTVTPAVIREAGRPVLSIPSSREAELPKSLSRILVATDLAPSSGRVIDFAVDLKERIDSELVILHVVELTKTLKFAITEGHLMDAPERMKDWAEDQLRNLIPDRYLDDRSVRRMVIAEGYASDRISDAAESLDVGLVVMGAHGYGPVRRHFVGTTADKVLAGLARPVLTVRV